jgi:hypothetical protein
MTMIVKGAQLRKSLNKRSGERKTAAGRIFSNKHAFDTMKVKRQEDGAAEKN